MVVLSQGKAKAKNRPNKFCSENAINVPMVPTFISPLGNFLGEVGPSCKEKVSEKSSTSHGGFSK